ncbi:MAG: Fic family protein [Coriobacteriales bacterium]|jgi:Fic family protein|nr:Fic family protein [Coriobacteriales bacterium]
MSEGYSNRELIEALRAQRTQGVRGGIYWKTQIDLAYNSNRIEGSRLTKDQTRSIFERGRVQGSATVRDIKETDNHFMMFDYMLDTLDEGTNIEGIRTLHRILKAGGSHDDGAGAWKLVPNEVGNIRTVAPAQVGYEVGRLVDTYNGYKRSGKTVGLLQVLAFHVQYERIHPFLDGNGRTGRCLMFAQCLQNDIPPFIIYDDDKDEYMQALAGWNPDNTAPFVSFCERLQQSYQEEYLYLLDNTYLSVAQDIDRSFEDMCSQPSLGDEAKDARAAVQREGWPGKGAVER